MSIKEKLANLSVWLRLAVLASAVWLIGSLAEIDPWAHVGLVDRHGAMGSLNNWDEFFMIGVLPVVALWGAIWVISGIKKKAR